MRLKLATSVGMPRVVWASAMAVALAAHPATCSNLTTCKDLAPSTCALLVADMAPFITQSLLTLSTSTSSNGALSMDSLVQDAQAYSQAATQTLVDHVDTIRGYDQNWFRTSLHLMATWGCASTLTEADKERCVAPNDPYAAMDATGTSCVRVSGPGNCSSLGLCERKATCYWPPPTDNREPYFSAAVVDAATEWVHTGYMESLVPYVIPGVFMSMVVLVATTGFITCRCGLGRCYGSKPFKHGYSKCGKLVPALVFVFFSLVVAVLTAIAWTQHKTMSDGVVGAFQALDMTFANLNILSTNTLAPLRAVQQELNSTIDRIRQDVSDTEWVHEDFSALQRVTSTLTTTMKTTMGPYPIGCTPGTSAVCIACPPSMCADFPAALTQWIASLDTVHEAVDRSTKTMQNSVASAQASLGGAMNAASALLTMVQTRATASQTSLQSAWDIFKRIAEYRVEVILALFVLGLVGALLGCIALCAGYYSNSARLIKLMHLSWGLSALVSFVGFLVSATMLVLAILGNDACHYVVEVQHDVESLWPGQLAKTLDSCYAGESPLDALDLASSLAFSCSLPSDLTAATTGPSTLVALDPLVDQMSSFTLSTFGVSAAIADQYIAQAAATTPGLTRANIQTPWVLYSMPDAGQACAVSPTTAATCFMASYCNPTTTCLVDFTRAHDYKVAVDQIELELQQVQGDFAGAAPVVHSPSWPGSLPPIRDMALQYTAALVALGNGPLRALQNGAVGNMLLHVDQVKCSMQCSWLAKSTNLLYTSVCSNLVGSTLTVSLCIFLMCFSLLPMIVMAIVLEKRLRGKTKVKGARQRPPVATDVEASTAKKANRVPATSPALQV
ncbi:hypothetical protein H310_08488 [Aphanomyces invadans]|uniref:Transmembrane protein n=1 Tax=Aphanomyces invadans TaxID=157072 RepID=A0A024TXY1_9STRA|nr:hypothetical protein H310_08488 [Aphanomyces invadans]ETV99015.1 hypothetical protein H310_08488 [Aphanomyces invadans]|eukprot:XP_008872443.1 hypothetical protein H310_08488 [Aphanomyces invadans]